MGKDECYPILLDYRQSFGSNRAVHSLTLVTRNVTDIAGTRVAYLNPFEHAL
jgi:hypothetical protein